MVNRVRLTQGMIEAAKPRKGAYMLRDRVVPGLMVRVHPSGRKAFVLDYRTFTGRRRKPTIGQFGQLTLGAARLLAQDWFQEVRRGGDPAEKREVERQSASMRELCDRFIEDYSKMRNRPGTVKAYRKLISRHILPAFSGKKAREVRRADVADLMSRLRHIPTTANRTLCCLRKMFNMAEVWGYRDDFTNPCRHVPSYPEQGETRYITDAELVRIFDYLDRAEWEGLVLPVLTLAVRLQFGFAARMSEILGLRWEWIDLVAGRVAWPDSKTGKISKPINSDNRTLLEAAAEWQRDAGIDSPFVCPSPRDPQRALDAGTYAKAWRRILEAAGVPHVGTHGIRHRAATDIANSGVPLKVGMQLTAHKTVSQFMRYVHPEDELVHAAAEHVSRRRSRLIDSRRKANRWKASTTLALPEA